MAFRSFCSIDNCVLQDLRKKSEYENGKKVGEKTVVDIVFFGDRPLTCEVPADKVSSLKLNLMGTVSFFESSVVFASEWNTADGRSGYSFKKQSSGFVFSDFVPNSGK